MNHEEAIRRLQQYHASEKVKVQGGIGFVSKPPPPTPTPVAEDPAIKAQQQLAKSYWDWAQALRGK